MKSYIQVNKFSKTPLYLQIKDSIKTAILDEELKDNDQLPTEEAICSFYNVSRPVVRQAYQELINEGLISRRQGQGTFVTRKYVFTNLPFNPNYNAFLLSKGINPESLILSVTQLKAKDLMGVFAFPPEIDWVYVIKRIRKGNGIPLMLEIFYWPELYFPKLEDHIHHDVVTSKVWEYYHIPVGQMKTELNSEVISDVLAPILSVEPNSAVFHFKFIHVSLDGHFTSFKESYFPGERHQIESELFNVYG